MAAQTRSGSLVIFFFNDTATTEIYTLSLHDALPICDGRRRCRPGGVQRLRDVRGVGRLGGGVAGPVNTFRGSDRKSTRLNSSHANISYAVFCLKKKHHRRLHFLLAAKEARSAEHTSE